MPAVTLTILNGPNRERGVTFGGESLSVGRSSAADFSIMDPRMSREHFLLVREGEAWQVRDLNSSNGTRVNDQRAADFLLASGDVILAGDTQFRVSFDDAMAAPENLQPPPQNEDQSNRATWQQDE